MRGRGEVGERPSSPGTLSAQLTELRTLEERIFEIPAIPLHGVPGRKPSSARKAGSEEDEAKLRALDDERNELLGRMAREALPSGRWVRHGGELLYLQQTPKHSTDGTIYELYRLPARSALWIPEDTDEAPSITERRVEYARWFRRAQAVLAATVAVFAGLVVYALLLWSLPESVLVGGLAVLWWALAGTYVTFSKLGSALEDGGPHAPFDFIAAGTGEASASLAAERQHRKEREREKLIKRIAPEAKSELDKTHDYDYEYAGFHPGGEASVRVRIYEDLDNHGQAPVIVLSQKYPPGGVSITNLIEAVAAEVVISELPELLPQSRREARRALRKPPFHVVKHYSEGHPYGGRHAGDGDDEDTSIVTFSDYRIQGPLGIPEVEHGEIGGEAVTVIHSNTTERPRFGEPEWHHEGRAAAERMVGECL